MPQKLISLANFLNLKISVKDKYYFDVDTKDQVKFNKFKFLKNKYILFHFDEKWRDIKNINHDLYQNLYFLNKKLKKNIVISTYKNNFIYFQNLKKKLKEKNNTNIHIIENSNLFFFERLINNSICAISCHSGFLVQIAGSNSSDIIDIINKTDYKWYSCWKPLNTKHKFIYKSLKSKKSINLIFKNLLTAIKSF